MFNVLCTVNGGVTGFHQSLLKEGGEVKEFGTYAEADAETNRLYKRVSPYSKAMYGYEVVTAE